MRRFKFRLETALRHRETMETLREQDFAVALGRLRVVEARIAALRAEFRQTLADRPGSAPGQRLDARDILDRERYLATLAAAIAQEERTLEAAQVQMEEARGALIQARQAREAVSRLRDKDLLAHNAGLLKMQQEMLDEQATLRYARENAATLPAMGNSPHPNTQRPTPDASRKENAV